MTEEKVKEFITFALGDVAESIAFRVEQNRKGEFYVIAMYPGLIYVSKDELRKEWEQAQNDNPEFKDIGLYCLY